MDFGPASADRSHTLPPAGTALQSIFTAVARGDRLARRRSEGRKEGWGRGESMAWIGWVGFRQGRGLARRGVLVEYYMEVKVRRN